MSVVWNTVKVGDVLWDSRREKMGNTTMSRLSSWPVRVISIDHEKGEAICSWNYNTPERYFKRSVERLRRTPARTRDGKCSSCGQLKPSCRCVA